MASPLPCRIAEWAEQIAQLGLPVAEVTECPGDATHLASVQYRRPGVVVTVAAHVCVWHAETIRQGTPGLLTLPHTPLTVAR
ncbi:hypothetical protein [Actinoplanes teichomyceticus]|uniref:Uncharacterized protein n=1 Tax=Actinoplanes teichomyceticus TaxID=1867 RepID=A0A561WAX9_ACTTI|nr:hypothetical protein [Actinoplanes teichomyceticus]TWG21011.1 hypothetical protein FHX34_103540 [Actinoplanes teichomyceticus]GIF14832.1 hypothetical protein Ate01nite_48640 [Actinoplanes teichomyceticus]